MTAGFAGWSLATGHAGVAVRRTRSAPGVTVALLLTAACGMTVLAVAHTQTIAGQLPTGRSLTWSGRAHDVAAAASSLCLLTSAVLSAGWRRTPRALRFTSAVVAALAMSVSAVLLASGDPVPGWRQRVLVALAVVWQTHLLIACAADGPPAAPSNRSRMRGPGFSRDG